jgi:hypothetical protein
MSAPPPGDLVDPDTSVAATVHLLHRRRGWALTLGSSLIALVAYVAIGVSVVPRPSPGMRQVNAAVAIGLLALAAAALIVVIMDTVRLRRREPSVLERAIGRTSHHPLVAHPFRTPVHHRVSHALMWVILVFFPLVALGTLPDQVNAFGYVLGAGGTVTFLPQSYGQACGRFGCHTVTDGVLETNPPVSATWPSEVVLGRPFGVRRPVWDGWGSPTLRNGPQSAGMIAGGLCLDLFSVGILIGIVVQAQRRLDRRRDTVTWPPAG